MYIEDEERRNDADHEHAAPSDVLKQQAVDDRSQEISGRVSRLQQSRHKASGLRRDRFHGERGAHPPFAAHGDAEQGAQDEQDREVWRETRGKFEDRVQQHVDHQGRAASPSVGRAPEQIGADRPHRQGQQNGESDLGNIGAEFLGDVLEDEHQKEKIKSVQRPPQEACGNDVPLFAGPARQRGNVHDHSPGGALHLRHGTYCGNHKRTTSSQEPHGEERP
jgi:hypothetical protein